MADTRCWKQAVDDVGAAHAGVLHHLSRSRRILRIGQVAGHAAAQGHFPVDDLFPQLGVIGQVFQPECRI